MWTLALHTTLQNIIPITKKNKVSIYQDHNCSQHGGNHILNRYSQIIPQKSLMHGKKERKLVAFSLFLFKAA